MLWGQIDLGIIRKNRKGNQLAKVLIKLAEQDCAMADRSVLKLLHPLVHCWVVRGPTIAPRYPAEEAMGIWAHEGVHHWIHALKASTAAKFAR